jgi:hypothetical protein
MAPSTRAARAVLAVVGIAVILVGCGSSTPTATASPVATAPAAASPTAEAPTSAAPSTSAGAGDPVATTGRIVDESAGFAVTLPDGWRRLDLTAEDREAIIGAGAENLSPEARTLLEGQLESLVASGLTFFAIDEVNATDQFVPNVNILATPTGGLTLDMLTQATVGQLRVAFPTMDGELVQEPVTLPSGEATHLSYNLPAGTAGAIALTFHQYLIVGDGTAYIVTVTGQDGAATAAAGEAVAGSFELLD